MRCLDPAGRYMRTDTAGLFLLFDIYVSSCQGFTFPYTWCAICCRTAQPRACRCSVTAVRMRTASRRPARPRQAAWTATAARRMPRYRASASHRRATAWQAIIRPRSPRYCRRARAPRHADWMQTAMRRCRASALLTAQPRMCA